MTTSKGHVKNADTASAQPPTSNFDLYAGDFSCDDDISFENLLRLDSDMDRPQPSTLPQPTMSPPAAQVTRQPSINAVQPSSIAGSHTDMTSPTAETVVYLLTGSNLRQPNSAVGDSFATVACNNVRPLLRFQISKKPISTAVAGYDIEIGRPIVAVGSNPKQRAPAALGLRTVDGCDMASITSLSDRMAAIPAGCPSTLSVTCCLALTTAFNGELPIATQQTLAAAAVEASTLAGPRTPKSNYPSISSLGGTKSRSAAAADARQTVQEKNAYEYERVMDILRYYRELVVERKLPGACLPCKRRKSKPLVSAETVTPVSTKFVPPPPLSSTPAVTVTATQYSSRTVAMSAWRVTPSVPVLRLNTGNFMTPSDNRLRTAVSSLYVSTTRPTVSQILTSSDSNIKEQDATEKSPALTMDSMFDEMLSRPSSVELGDQVDCSKDLIRSCHSAPGLYNDTNEFMSALATVTDKTRLEHRRPHSDLFNSSRRRRTLRRSVDKQRFVSRSSLLQNQELNNWQHNTNGQLKDETVEVSVWVKPVASLPVKHISTRTTDTIVVKWTEAHLAISGPYQSWT